MNEAIVVELDGLGPIGHVANSVNTVLGESYSAGRIYDKFKKKALANASEFLTHTVDLRCFTEYDTDG